MDGIEAPLYYLCPISLEIMEDPVTTVTGITYDRKSIERWLFSGNNKTCPVTNQPITGDSDLTPNHTLRRLIQSWSSSIKVNGSLQAPRATVNDDTVLFKLLDDLSIPTLVDKTLKSLETIVSDGENNRRTAIRAGVGRTVISFIVSYYKKNGQHRLDYVERALKILILIRAWSEFDNSDESSSSRSHDLPIEYDLIESMTWVLNNHGPNNRESRGDAILLLKSMFQSMTNSPPPPIGLMERLNPDFFKSTVQILRARRISAQTTKAALQILLLACPFGTNKTKMVESGAVKEIIELELTAPDKRTTELDLTLLDQLCSCSGGREQFLTHAAGIAMVTKRILRVSPAADEKAVGILMAIAKHWANAEVLYEMLRVGGVSKLCMVLQANCSGLVKARARSVLKLHSSVWMNSPCIAVYLLTRQ